MKYCPYCGADIIDGAVSFCVECGKELPTKKQKENQETTPKRKPVAAKKKKSKKKKSVPISDTELRSEYDEGYDGYYEDLLPIDDGIQIYGWLPYNAMTLCGYNGTSVTRSPTTMKVGR